MPGVGNPAGLHGTALLNLAHQECSAPTIELQLSCFSAWISFSLKHPANVSRIFAGTLVKIGPMPEHSVTSPPCGNDRKPGAQNENQANAENK